MKRDVSKTRRLYTLTSMTGLLLTLALLSGCGLFGGKQVPGDEAYGSSATVQKVERYTGEKSRKSPLYTRPEKNWLLPLTAWAIKRP